MYDTLLLSWIGTEKWEFLKVATLALAKSLDAYVTYLKSQCKKMAAHHSACSIPVADIGSS